MNHQLGKSRLRNTLITTAVGLFGVGAGLGTMGVHGAGAATLDPSRALMKDAGGCAASGFTKISKFNAAKHTFNIQEATLNLQTAEPGKPVTCKVTYNSSTIFLTRNGTIISNAQGQSKLKNGVSLSVDGNVSGSTIKTGTIEFGK